ncbi:MAG TPA: T9SS type A sorting domain-containing protein, partial [Bacteroidales bacterium]|nr:T9SS type A sorting domain-containing protein [Bacteroidales bacterium]
NTTYTVTESIIATGCTNSNSVTVTVNPLPFLVITNPAPVCSPNKVDLTAAYVTAGSTPGIILTYWTDPAATIPCPTPAAVTNGTYYIKGTSPVTGCSAMAAVVAKVNPLPTAFNGTGSGSYCPGGPGLTVGISGSQVGVVYTLWYGCCSQMGSPVAGTGGPITFSPPLTQTGNFSVYAENTTTHCSNWMYNCIVITPAQFVPVSVSIIPSANPVPVGISVVFTATPVNGGASPVYQWKVNGLNAGTNSASFTYIPSDGDDVTCVLTSSLPCTTGNPATSNVITMEVQGLTSIVAVTGIIPVGKSKCYSAVQTLLVAGEGNTFRVENGGSAVMIAGHNIRYLPGTKVEAGGYMRGYITTNNQYCGQSSPALPAVIAGEESIPELPGPVTLVLYPNPTSGVFSLELRSGTLNGKVHAELCTLHGERLMTADMTGEKKHEFRMPQLPAGLYVLKVFAEGYTETFKLVKTR